MNFSVRYYTRSGNTKKLATAIASALKTDALDISNPLEEKVDLLFLGCSYYAFDIDDEVKNFIRENKTYIKKIVCFGTSAMLGSTKKQVKKFADELGIPVEDAEFHCYGSFGPMHKGCPNESDTKAAMEFATKTKEKYTKENI